MDIADYTADTWGPEHAQRDLDSLEACFHRLVETPRIGRACDQIRTGYCRIEHEKDVIFYRADDDGIFISRVLHQRMLPSFHSVDDE